MAACVFQYRWGRVGDSEIRNKIGANEHPIEQLSLRMKAEQQVFYDDVVC